MGEQQYSGYIGIEYVRIDWEHCNEVDNLSETILFRDFVRQRENSEWKVLEPTRDDGNY